MIIALVWKRFMAKWRQDLKMNVSFRWRQKWDKILSAGGKEAKCQSWAKGWHASANCYQATADGGGDDDGAGGRDNAGDDGGGGGGDDDDDEDDGGGAGDEKHDDMHRPHVIKQQQMDMEQTTPQHTCPAPGQTQNQGH